MQHFDIWAVLGYLSRKIIRKQLSLFKKEETIPHGCTENLSTREQLMLKGSHTLGLLFCKPFVNHKNSRPCSYTPAVQEYNLFHPFLLLTSLVW